MITDESNPPRYSLRSHSEYQSKLLNAQGQPIAVVNGDQISFQQDFGELTLIATHYDYFDGCNHWLYLFRGNTLLDQLTLPDSFGFVNKVQRISANTLQFSFHVICEPRDDETPQARNWRLYYEKNQAWEVTVNPQGHWNWHWSALKRRPNRFLLSRRYLQVRCINASDLEVQCQSAIQPDDGDP